VACQEDPRSALFQISHRTNEHLDKVVASLIREHFTTERFTDLEKLNLLFT